MIRMKRGQDGRLVVQEKRGSKIRMKRGQDGKLEVQGGMKGEEGTEG